MANLFDTDTELKSVINTSDGDDHQLYVDGSQRLLRTEVHDDDISESDVIRRLMRINQLRKTSHSISDNSDVDSQRGIEYHPTPKPWLESEERFRGQDRSGPKIHDSRSQISPQFGDDENERRWQKIREARNDDGEQ